MTAVAAEFAGAALPLVVVALFGPGLPGFLVRPAPPECADQLVISCSLEVDTAVLVWLGETADAAGVQEALQAVRAGLPVHVKVLDLLVVGDDRWWSLACHDAACCPASGHPLPEMSDLGG